MKKMNILVLMSAIGFLVGCGGNSNIESSDIDYNGNYNVIVISSTKTDNNGNTCQGANGLMNITNSKITGKVTTDFGDIFDIDGNIASNGNVKGGFAVTGYNVASYTGSISITAGEGTWKDIYGCSGEWAVSKI